MGHLDKHTMSIRKNALIVGHGSIGSRHKSVVEACESVDKTTTIGQRDFDLAFEGKTSDERDEYLYELAGGKPDFVIIAGPASTHIKTASYFVNMNVPMIIEKPLSHNCDGVNNFLSSVDSKQLCVSVGYNLRFVSSLQRFKQVIDDGVLGEIHSVRCEVGQYLPDWRPDADYKQSVSANASMGGGVLLELSHEIDYLQWIFGPIKAVSGYVKNTDRLDIDVEDTAHLLFSLTKKQDKKSLMVSVDMDFIRRDPTRVCLVIGEHGTLRWDGIADEVSIYNTDHSQWKLVYKGNMSRDESYKKALHLFIDCIDNNRSPLVTANDGSSVLNVIEAIRQSSDSHQLVNTRN